MAFEELAAQGRRALADGDATQAARVLRDALLAWRGQPLADAAGSDLAEATAARLTELRSSILADRIEADLALGEGASLVGELRVLLADQLGVDPSAQLEQVYLGILRSDAMKPRIQCVRQGVVTRSSARTAGLVPLARVAEHDLVPGRYRGPPTARCLPALACRLLTRGLRLS